MAEYQAQNSILLRGTVVGEVQVSHENHGVVYSTFPLEVQRLSGAVDTLNLLVGAPLLQGCPLSEGMGLSVTGQVRSYNNRSGVGSRLVITTLVGRMEPWEGEHMNQLALTGALCKPPVYRQTPLGREICDLMLAVNRAYGRTDYLPCIAWGSLAGVCSHYQVGSPLSLLGRLQSRGYQKTIGDTVTHHTAYEVSVMELAPSPLKTEPEGADFV